MQRNAGSNPVPGANFKHTDMAKRKYTRGNEEPVSFECTKRACKWKGTDEDKKSKKVDSIMSVLVCPNCGNDEFYGLLKDEKTK